MDKKKESHHQFTLNQVTYIILIVTLVAPLAIFWHGGSNGTVYVSIIAVTWVFLHFGQDNIVFGISGGGLHLLNPIAILTTSILWVFNALFALYVIRYYQGRTSKRFVLVLGALTLLIPLLNVIQAIDFLWKSRLLVYIGPIPIQLVVGLVLIRHKALDKDVSRKKSDYPSEPW